MVKRLLARGHTDPKYHAVSHARVSEAEAFNRLIGMAAQVDQPIMIFNVSMAEDAKVIRDARGQGLKVFAETCPQYLFARVGGEAAKPTGRLVGAVSAADRRCARRHGSAGSVGDHGARRVWPCFSSKTRAWSGLLAGSSSMASQKGPNIKKKQRCKNCEGKGLLKKGDKVVKCQRCGGTGVR
jgi:hypothetical protein